MFMDVPNLLVFDVVWFYTWGRIILTLVTVASSSLMVIILYIILFSLFWFIALMTVINQFFWGAILALLYLRGIIVLFTYSIILSRAVRGSFRYSMVSLGELLVLIIVFSYFLRENLICFSIEDRIFHLYPSFWSFFCVLLLVLILVFCVKKLTEDYV